MTIQVQPISVALITIGIRGTSPLIQHQWSEKAKRQLRMTAAERRKEPKVARDRDAEATAAAYTTADGAFGIPLLAFKTALISAAHKDIGLEKTMVRKSLFIHDADGSGVLHMERDDPIIREDMVRVGAGSADMRYRPEFRNWRASITMEVDIEKLDEKNIVNLVNRAGFGVGICEWRPEKGGEFGRFEIDPSVVVKVEQK